jgi:hypothetical protein
MIERSLAAVVSAVLVLGVLFGGQASAEQAPPTFCTTNSCGGAAANGGAVRVVGVVSDKVPGRERATPGGGVQQRDEWIEIDEYLTPACYSNGLQGEDMMCPSALASCPEGLVRYWIWQREIRHSGGGEPQIAPWEQLPGSYCLGSDDPGVPDYGRAISLVQRGFQDLPLPRADVEVAPAPTSLVHVRTAFFAGGAQTFTQTVTPVPGISVTVSAQPTSWTWHWGDGTSRTFSTPGEPRKPVVSHPYTSARDYSAHVEVSWKGSFTIAGSSEVFDIPTPAVVTSDPVTVQVREARTELVDGR